MTPVLNNQNENGHHENDHHGTEVVKKVLDLENKKILLREKETDHNFQIAKFPNSKR